MPISTALILMTAAALSTWLWLPIGLVVSRRMGCVSGAMGGRGGRKPTALGLPASLALASLLGFVACMADLTEADAYYPAVRQGQLTATLLGATVIAWAWGAWMDRGNGGLETLLVMAIGHTLLWSAGLRIDLLRLPFAGEVTLSPLLSFAVTLAWLALVGAIIEWLDAVDGLAALAAGALATAVLVQSIFQSPGDLYVAALAAVIAGVAFAVVPLNRPPRPFAVAGKSLTLPLGLWIAALTIIARLKTPAAGIVLPMVGAVAVGGLLLMRWFAESLLLRSTPPDR